MPRWRAVWKMAGFSWRGEWKGFLLTLALALYVGWLVSMMLGDIMQRDRDSATSLEIVLDWMYLLLFPAFGQCMNRSSFRIMREDVFTRQVAHWRTLPIPLSTIIQARLLRSILLIPVLGVIFVLLQYSVTAEFRELLSPGGWLAFVWIWICYGLAINALLIWLELGCSGKWYMLIYSVVMLVSGLLAGGLKLFDINLVNGTIDQIAAGHYGWLPAVTLLSALLLFAGYRLTLRRMQHRAYHF